MKNLTLTIVFFIGFCGLSYSLYAQPDLALQINVSPGANYASVVDNDTRSSALSIAADGATVRERVEGASSLRILVDINSQEKMMLSAGLGIMNRQFMIRNTDGFYTGVSLYKTSYLQIPVLAKFKTDEIADNISLLFAAGPLMELKLSEDVEGDDNAHYWNLANNRTDLDPIRGDNGNGNAVNLFSAFGLGLHFSASALYEISDQIALNLGFSYQFGLNNMVGSTLLFNNNSKTQVNDDVEWRSRVLALDLGVVIQLNN